MPLFKPSYSCKSTCVFVSPSKMTQQSSPIRYNANLTNSISKFCASVIYIPARRPVVSKPRKSLNGNNNNFSCSNNYSTIIRLPNLPNKKLPICESSNFSVLLPG